MHLQCECKRVHTYSWCSDDERNSCRTTCCSDPPPGSERKRGRKLLAAPAWEMMPFAIDTPPQDPQQDPGILYGAIPAVAPNVVAGENLVADLIAE